MLSIRRSKERGHANHGWLDTWHTFSFNTYYDPRFMGFRALRVINEDRVRPAQGFGAHGHRDMEILTWILSGTLARTVACPVPVQARARLRGARAAAAGRGYLNLSWSSGGYRSAARS